MSGCRSEKQVLEPVHFASGFIADVAVLEIQEMNVALQVMSKCSERFYGQSASLRYNGFFRSGAATMM